MNLLALICVAAPMAAAVPAIPEAGPSGVLPTFTLTTTNDLLGNGLGNGDDFRTAGVSGAWRLDHVVVAVDGAMLTDRAAATRTDQLTILAGVWLGPLRPRLGWQVGSFLGAGVQLAGDLGGQDMQNWVHRTINVDQVHVAYDPGQGARAIVGASVVGGWLSAVPPGLSMTGWWGVQMVAAGTTVCDGEQLWEAGPRLVLVGLESAFWLGTRWRGMQGASTGPTVAATLDHEVGWWLEVGTTITPLRCGGSNLGWHMRSAFNPETRATLGSLGLLLQPGGGPSGASLDLQHDLAIYDGGGVGLQLRWLPYPYQDTRRSALVLDYRFGTNPDGQLDWNNGPGGPAGAEQRHDQITLGWEEGLRSPAWSGVRLTAAIDVSAGVRTEGVLAQGAGARTLAAHATTGVFRQSGVVRLEFGETLSLGVSLDGWLPWWHESVTNQSAGATVLNAPDWTTGIHLAAHVAW